MHALRRRQRTPRRGGYRLEVVQALEYEMPLRRGFSTARGTSRSATNIVVLLTAVNGRDERVVGLGEANPRRRLTGDDPQHSWEYLRAAAERLHDLDLELTDPSAALAEVEGLLDDLDDLAARLAPEEVGSRPFRGTRAGLEVALLDLCARAFDTSVANLLGAQRRRVTISASTITSGFEERKLRKKLSRQARRFPVTRLKGSGDLAADLELMHTAAAVNRRRRARKPLWIDVNEALDPPAASELIDRIAAAMREGTLPRQCIVEQPVPGGHLAELPRLQRRADEQLAAARRRGLDLRVMADESLWDAEDMRALIDAGGCRAINIKIQKTGGLLAARRLADVALAADPATHVYIGGMLGTSDITAWTLHGLARALPRIDYLTAVPPGNVETRIATPELAYRGKSNRLVDQRGPGIGTTLELERVLPYVTRRLRIPAPARAGADRERPSNVYAMPHLGRLGKASLPSHLLEAEALRRGLTTTRLAPGLFTASDAHGAATIGFNSGASSATSRVANIVCASKERTRQLLEANGIPVPRGRRFDGAHQRSEARAYAEELGFPLVVKPAAGSGGRGVVTDITNPRELSWAIDALDRASSGRKERFIIEEHLPGADYRFLVVGNEVRSVLLRTPAHVVGDGTSTIVELVIDKNETRQRNPHLRFRPLRLDEAAAFQLERQGVRSTDVPAPGQRIDLTRTGNFSLGGDSEEVFDEVHPSVLEVAVAARRALPGIAHAGVDVLLEDHRRPIDAQRVGICEINSVPEIASHHFPHVGPGRDAAAAIVEETAQREGLALLEPAEEVALSVRVDGRVQQVGYRAWIRRLAHELELEATAGNLDGGSVEVTVSGRTEVVAVLACLAVRGPRRAAPSMVRTTPSR